MHQSIIWVSVDIPQKIFELQSNRDTYNLQNKPKKKNKSFEIYLESNAL